MARVLLVLAVGLVLQLTQGCNVPKVQYAAVRYSHSRFGPYKPGTIVWFQCNRGYEMKGSGRLVCDSYDNWSDDLPKCMKPCANPRTFFGGQFYPDKPKYMYDDKVYYACPGKNWMRTHSTCQMDGKWKQASDCYDDGCMAPKYDEYHHMPYAKKTYKKGEYIKYMCKDGYYKESKYGYDTAMCMDNGNWDKSPYKCMKKCMAPKYDDYYHKSYAKKMYMKGEYIKYMCKDGYYKDSKYGYDKAMCMDDGKWGHPPYKCMKKCMAPKYDDYYHKSYAKKMYMKGEYIKYMCKDGYYKDSKYGYDKAMCMDNGKWGHPPYKCMMKKYCKKPMIEHGMPEPEKKMYDYGDKVSYKCKDGYMLFYDGPWFEYSTCKKDGMWDFKPPICKKKEVYCKMPYVGEHGIVEPMKKKYSKGDRVSYKCKDGYDLFYEDEWFQYATCKDDGNWDFKAPKCRSNQKKYCMPDKVEHGYYFPSMKMYMEGDRMYHRCKSGYGLFYKNDWYEYRTCGKDGKWDFDPPMCKSMRYSSGSSCMGYDVMYGRRRPDKKTYADGEKVYYDCAVGYEKHYDSEKYEYAMCKNGMWDKQPPMCKSIYKNYCYPPRMMYGSYYPKMMRYNYGDRLRYKCNYGYGMYYKKERYEYATCGRDGNWDKQPPMCKSNKIDYCDAPKFEHGYYMPMMKKYSPGDRLYYTKCKEGYMLTYGKDWFEYNMCQDDGTWKFMHPMCKMAKKAYCDPPKINYGMPVPQNRAYPYGAKVSYKCNDGYELYYEGHQYQYASCKPGGYWDKKAPMCKKVMNKYCYPPTFHYGSYWPMFQRYQEGSKIYYHCDRGYKKVYKGEEYQYNKCINGKWKYEDHPKCMDMKKKYCKAPKFEYGKLMPDKKMYSMGDRVSYKCNDGYYKVYDGQYYRYATCGKDGMWDKKPPMCKKMDKGYCMHKPMQYGQYSPMKPKYQQGDRVYYTCSSGYDLKYRDGKKYQYNMCGKDGKWEHYAPKCVKKGKQYCPKPTIEHGTYKPMMDYYDEGDRIYVKCKPGYYKYYEGYSQRYSTCMKNGKWDKLPQCKKMPMKYCKAPDHRMYHHMSYYKKMYMKGEYIKYECGYGYYASSNIKRKYAMCMEDGNWDMQPYKCKKYCMGDEIMHGSYSPMKMYYGYNEKVSYKCKDGYQMVYHGVKYQYRTCKEDGNWDYKPPMCKKYCMAPKYDDYYHMPYAKKMYMKGEYIKYMCKDGYYKDSKYGYDKAMCMDNGKWGQPPYKCMIKKPAPVYCQAPSSYPYGYYFPGKPNFAYGEAISFYCNRGYRLNKSYNQVYCGRNGKWVADLPYCGRIWG